MTTISDRPFIGQARHYDRNVESASVTYAKAGYMDGPHGLQPAVTIFRDRYLVAILPTYEALRISNEITDAVDAHERGAL